MQSPEKKEWAGGFPLSPFQESKIGIHPKKRLANFFGVVVDKAGLERVVLQVSCDGQTSVCEHSEDHLSDTFWVFCYSSIRSKCLD